MVRSQIGFLLSLAPLGIACGESAMSDAAGDGSETSGGGATDVASSSGPGDDETTSADDDTGDATGRGEDTAGAASTGDSGSTLGLGTETGREDDGTTSSVADSSGGMMGSTGDEGSTGDTGGRIECPRPPDVGEILEACVGYVQVLDMCLGERPLSRECIAYEEAVCQYQINYDVMIAGKDCLLAYEELYACLSVLTCREFDADPCPEEGAAWAEACFGMDRPARGRYLGSWR